MATGRCAGCGRIASLRKISQHIVDCESYIELYKREPAQCLDPVAELNRFRDQGGAPQARAEQRDERLRARFAEINRQQLASASRWAKPPDILE